MDWWSRVVQRHCNLLATERPGWVVLTVWSRVIIFRSTREVGGLYVLAAPNNDEHFGKSS